MLNSVSLVGRLTEDPKVTVIRDGVKVVNMRIAVDRPISNEAKQSGAQSVDFIPVVAWDQNAKYAENYLTKGRMVSVQGRLQFRPYQDNNSGTKHISSEVVAYELRGLDSPNKNNENTRTQEERPTNNQRNFTTQDPFAP